MSEPAAPPAASRQCSPRPQAPSARSATPTAGGFSQESPCAFGGRLPRDALPPGDAVAPERARVPRTDRSRVACRAARSPPALGLGWPRLGRRRRRPRLLPAVVEPVRSLAGRTIDIPAVLLGAPPRHDRRPSRGLLRAAPSATRRCRTSPTAPASSSTRRTSSPASSRRFSKPFMADYRVGTIERPTVRLALAVAASSAFPPFLSPVRPKLELDAYASGRGALTDARYRRRPMLTDGGVYDNLGLETAWKEYETVLVSDGGGQYQPAGRQGELAPPDAPRDRHDRQPGAGAPQAPGHRRARGRSPRGRLLEHLERDRRLPSRRRARRSRRAHEAARPPPDAPEEARPHGAGAARELGLRNLRHHDPQTRRAGTPRPSGLPYEATGI